MFRQESVWGLEQCLILRGCWTMNAIKMELRPVVRSVWIQPSHFANALILFFCIGVERSLGGTVTIILIVIFNNMFFLSHL